MNTDAGGAGKGGLELKGAEKVSALLMAMGKPLADRVIKSFDPGELRLLARAAASLPAVTPEIIDTLVDELQSDLEGSITLSGSTGQAQQLIAGVVSDDEVSAIMSELEGTSHNRIWAKLEGVSEEKLAEFISKEQPQVAAFIVSKLPVTKASAVLEKLDGENAGELSGRMLRLKEPSEDAVKLVAERLEQDLFASGAGSDGANRHAQLGAILNQIERPRAQSILASIEQQDADEARRVRKHVFGFEDIPTMAREDRVRLMEEVQADRLSIALREAPPELVSCILDALSQRSRRLIESELSTPVRVDAKAIAEIRRGIASLAISMAERSMIRLRPEEDAADAQGA